MKRVSKQELEALRNSELFDEKYYLEQYPDVKKLGMDPLEHYVWIGAKLKRNPSPKFAIDAYFNRTRGAGIHVNPWLSYLQSEKEEVVSNIAPANEYSAVDMNCSTFNEERSFAFLPLQGVEAVAEKYRHIRLWRNEEKRKIAFFSAITGGYDNLNYHENLLQNANYYLFLDELENRYIYQPRRAPYFDEDPVRSARFVKTHAHMLLSEYRTAIWTDGNILVRGDLSPLVAQFEDSGCPVGAIPHPLRSSVYDEARECIKRKKDDPSTIEAQMMRYRSEGFDSNDLVESNFMMFRIGHPQLASFLSSWWAEIERGSRRDQLSFNYAMAKSGATWFPLANRPNSVRNHPHLALFHHRSNLCPYEPKAALQVETERPYSDVMEERINLQKDRKVDVIVCVHNALDAVKLCLQSVATNRDTDWHRIVIVNDGSGEETTAWLEEFSTGHSNVHLIRNEYAGGYTRAANAGLRVMDAEMAILLNSDTVVAGRWIEKLLDATYSNVGVGIVGPLSSAASHQSIPDHRSTANQTAINDLPEGYTVADMNAWCEKNSPANFIPRVPLVHGFCFALTREVVEKVGFFDEMNFPFGYGEENDYCFRAVDAGFSLAVATHTYVYHEKSQSYQSEQRVALVKAGNMRIRELHGTERVLRAVRSMQTHPHLERIRKTAAILYNII